MEQGLAFLRASANRADEPIYSTQYRQANRRGLSKRVHHNPYSIEDADAASKRMHSYSALDYELLNIQLSFATNGDRPESLKCGLRYVCAIVRVPFEPAEEVAMGWKINSGILGYKAYCTGAALTMQIAETDGAVFSSYYPIAWGDAFATTWVAFDAGWQHACGIGAYGYMRCFGDAPVQ